MVSVLDNNGKLSLMLTAGFVQMRASVCLFCLAHVILNATMPCLFFERHSDVQQHILCAPASKLCSTDQKNVLKSPV